MLANVTWPSLAFQHRSHAWWMILLAIAIELLIVRKSLKTGMLAALGIVVAMNTFSALISLIITIEGLPLLPWLGWYWTIVVDQGYLTWHAFGVSTLGAAVLSTLLEIFCLLTVFRRIAGRGSAAPVVVANVASAELTFLSMHAFGVPW